jgi:uncharacterized protein YkwD
MSICRSLSMKIAVSAIALLLGAVALSACGGDDGGTPRAAGGKAAARSGLGTPLTATNEHDGSIRPDVTEREPDESSLQDVAPADEQALADGAGSCGATDAEPSAPTLGVSAQAILCLLNVERAARGLAALRMNPRLSRAARGHSEDMVRNLYFSHDAKNGTSMLDRIKSTGYLKARLAFTVGENIGWGSGSLSTPDALVKAWMNSPPHRANILQGRYRELGVGLILGAPASGVEGTAVTATTNFGRVGR